MVDVRKASATALEHFQYRSVAFYGDAATLNVGAGLFYDNIRYPLYDMPGRVFDTVAGLVYVLTHECDVDAKNDRHFNDSVLICPVIDFASFVEEYAGRFSDGGLFGLLPDLAGDTVFRAFYLPPHPSVGFANGGILYLNQICSTHIREFRAREATARFALSEYGQQILDYKLQNHLFRPKAEPLAQFR